MPGPKKQLSLDANFVFDLAAEKEFAHDFLEVFQRKGYALLLPPTAFHELHTILIEGDIEADRKLAGIALRCVTQWSIRPFDLDSTAEAICMQFVRSLVHQRLIPEEEFNDGLILAETSFEQIPLLVTSDSTCWKSTKMRCSWRSTKPNFRRFMRSTRNACCVLCVESPA